MDKSEVQKWVDENAERIKLEMGLDHWRLNVKLEPPDKEEGSQLVPFMCVAHNFEYELATVWIDFDQADNPEILEKHFRHELMHVMHSPFEMIWGLISKALDETQRSMVGSAWNKAEELTVRNLEKWYAKQKGF